MIEVIVAFLCGSILTLLLTGAGVLGWLYSQSRPVKDDGSTEDRAFIRPQLPEVGAHKQFSWGYVELLTVTVASPA